MKQTLTHKHMLQGAWTLNPKVCVCVCVCVFVTMFARTRAYECVRAGARKTATGSVFAICMSTSSICDLQVHSNIYIHIYIYIYINIYTCIYTHVYAHSISTNLNTSSSALY